jgi:cytochrome P450
MSVLTEKAAPTATHPELIGTAEPSPAGPVEDLRGLKIPPSVRLPRPVQVIWFGQFQWNYMRHYQRKFGAVWLASGYVRGKTASTYHPDHIRSIFTASPDKVPTLAAESPLRPVLGPGSVLTSNGPRHLRQRKLLLPPFHGEAIARYEQMILDATERELDRWPIGKPMSLAPRMQAITLDVIMAGIFGIEGKPRPGTAEFALRQSIKTVLWSSTQPGAKLAEWMNIGHDEPFGLTKIGLFMPDRCTYAVIAKRRKDPKLEERTDIMSLIMRARTEEGDTLTDSELRDELMTLVLAGHETTANQLAWAWERLTRTPAAHDRLREGVRDDPDNATEVVEATINEAMRVRPVIPVTGRRVAVPWQLGEYGIPADTGVALSMLLLHHREDLYPDPYAFRPERWYGHKPGTYEWMPFGGGTRRCLGAALAMAEQRVVLGEMARRLEIEAVDQKPERPKHRNVTMIPARGGRVVIRARTA